MVHNDLTFFTNEPERDLYSRFSKILKSNVQFFDILVGYFRTSGFFKMYEAMESVEKIRILVGLNVDKYTVKIIDKANAQIAFDAPTVKEAKEAFSESVEDEFNKSETSAEIEQGVRTFIEWLKNGKLEMRMYIDAPIHAKVYIMRKDMEKTPDTYGSVITGSSNFSEAGLQNNLEFNVELKDSRDVEFALNKFEELWSKGVPITEDYVEAVEKKTWLRNDITPYEIYLKTLYEFFKEEINADKDLLAENLLPEGYMKLQYQLDAVVQAKKILEAYNGVFISDVVGLGKTYICAMLAKSLKKGKKLIICPPVLVDYWKDFILYGDLMKDEDTTKASREGNRDMLISSNIFDLQTGVNRLKELDDLLATVRVADLAVGSGAFPLGMLNEIVKARETLSAYMAIGMNAFQKKSFYAYDRKPYDLKVNTIKNCIYACDIEPSAVDIAKLRLWLSIVIDDEIAAEAGNGEFDAHTKPRQLPNLDCNIICGNSLIDEFKGNKLISESELLHNVSENSQMTIYQGGVDSLISELIKLQDKLFFVKEHDEKEEIKQKIQDIYNQIILEQLHGNPELIEEYYEAIKESSKPFILWQLYFPHVFRDNGGFDIVIGNPPYVGEKGNKELFRPIAATDFGKKYYYGKMDLFYFFFHKGIDLGNDTAEISLITTNYYPTAFGGVVLRKDFKERTQVRRLINFNELKIFESALGQHNMITMLTKNKAKEIISKNSMCKISKVADSNLMKDVLYSVDENTDVFDVYMVAQEELYDGQEQYIRIAGCGLSDENSVNSVLLKIQDNNLLLKDIADIKQGIVSGADKYTDAHEAKYGLGHAKGKGIFVISTSDMLDLGIPDDEVQKYVKKVYKNSQVSRYNISYTDELCVFYLTKER